MRLRLLLAILAGWAAARWASTYHRFEVSERSMQPSLAPGDYVLASRRSAALGVGDVVIFEHPVEQGFWLVKRVVGLPGDEISVQDGRLTRNGAAVDGAPTPGAGSWTVPPGTIFVVGDNRYVSAGDSRLLGPIPVGLVEGRVAFRYWPLGTMGPIK